MVGNDEEHTSGRTADEPPAGASESPGASKWQLVIAAARRLRERGLEVTAEAAAQEAGVPVEEISRNWPVLARQFDASDSGDDPLPDPPRVAEPGRGGRHTGRGKDSGSTGEQRRAAQPGASRDSAPGARQSTAAWERMLAAAREITAQPDWRPVTKAEFARRAGVDRMTVHNRLGELESEFPGLLKPPPRRRQNRLATRSSRTTRDPETSKPATTTAKAGSGPTRIAQLIRRDIANRHYQPRQRLVVQRLARNYDVSTWTVRPALEMLLAQPERWVEREGEGTNTRWFAPPNHQPHPD
jgi:hypothetical protein